MTMVSGSGEQTAWRPLSVKGTNTEKRSSCPLTVIGFKRKKATTCPRHEETERQPGNHKGSSAKFPVKISKVLREIFAAFLEAGRAVSRARPREDAPRKSVVPPPHRAAGVVVFARPEFVFVFQIKVRSLHRLYC